jgi:N-acetylglucosaminyldiphosphoundecaprenol N-acetyl-beta-D-mannosaminyltransferase
MTAIPTVRLESVDFAVADEHRAVDVVASSLEQGSGGTLLTLNTDRLRHATQNLLYRTLCERATLVVADGMPLVWAARLSGQRLPSRVAGVDLVVALARRCAVDGRSVFLLGGPPGHAERTADLLVRTFPGLKVAGTACPDFGFEHDPAQMDALRRQLLDADPDVVFVALGIGKEERLMEEFRGTFPATWWMTVGASFSFLSGALPRAPHWMRDRGMEWMHRLVHQPHLARRYLVHDLPYATGLLVRSFAKRRRGG